MSFEAYVEKLISDNAKLVKCYVSDILQTMNELGYPDSKDESRLKTAFSKQKEVWEEVLNSELNIKKIALNNIERLKKLCFTLSEEVGTKHPSIRADWTIFQKEELLNDTYSELTTKKTALVINIEYLGKLRFSLGQELGAELAALEPDGSLLEKEKALSDSVAELIESKERVTDSLISLDKKCRALCEELASEYPPLESDITLLKKEKQLQKAIAQLRTRKENRMIPARLLFQTEDRACKRLGFEKLSGDRKRVPTAEQFQLLHERVTNLEAIIALRQAEYVTLTDSIRSAWDELEISAQHFEDPSTVILTLENLENIREIEKSLISRIADLSGETY